MRSFILLFSLSVILCGIAYSPAVAQTDPQETQEKATPEQEQTESAEGRETQEPIDLDAFFKRGEDNAKDASCDKPSAPIA